jgi:hypothetical protein
VGILGSNAPVDLPKKDHLTLLYLRASAFDVNRGSLRRSAMFIGREQLEAQ